MLYVHIKHPLTAGALIFLLLAGIIIRINEYRIPAFARNLHAPAQALLNTYKQEYFSQVVPDSENAALIYEQAAQILLEQEEKERNIYKHLLYWSWRHGKQYVNTGEMELPFPITGFTETQKREIGSYLASRQEAMALLYQAADTTKVFWALGDGEEQWERFRSWSSGDDTQALLLDILFHCIHHDEAGALRAVKSLDALIHATEKTFPPSRMGRACFSSNRYPSLHTLLFYGIETGLFYDLFSTEGLDVIDALLTYDEDPRNRTILYITGVIYYINASSRGQKFADWTTDRFKDNVQVSSSPFGRNESPSIYCLGRGLYWYKLRFEARSAMKQVIICDIVRQQFLKPDSKSGVIPDTNLLERAEHSPFIYCLNTEDLVDPYLTDRFLVCTDINYAWWVYFAGEEINGYLTRLAVRAAIAAEKYRRKAGAFPDTIEQVAPAFLPDDFIHAFDEAFAYTRTNTGWDINLKKNFRSHYGRRNRDIPYLQYPVTSN